MTIYPNIKTWRKKKEIEIEILLIEIKWQGRVIILSTDFRENGSCHPNLI